MKTIFITSFHPLISRNILATSFLDAVLDSGDIRIVLLVPEKKKDFFEREFARPGVLVEGVSRKFNWRDLLMRYLSLAAVKSRSLEIKRRTEMGGSGAWLAAVIGNRALARRIIRGLDWLLTPCGRFGPLLGRYQPRVVFSTDVQNENDVRLIREAKSRGISIIGMVRSWDNLTAKGLLRVLPDRLVIHNDIIKKEAIKLHGVEESRISVVGIPHYDRYFSKEVGSRGQFCSRLNLDSKKRFVIYIPLGDRYLGENTVDCDLIELIASFLPPSHHLIVRLPPTDSVNLAGLPQFPNVTVMRPGEQISRNPSMFRNNELTREDDEILRNMIFHCELVVSSPSTFIIDAAIFDKPIILPAFDGKKTRPYYQSIRRYFDYDHQAPILSSGGARLVRTPDELKEAIQLYLQHPETDKEGRRRIVMEQCWRDDGNSSRRLASLILETLNPNLK